MIKLRYKRFFIISPCLPNFVDIELIVLYIELLMITYSPNSADVHNLGITTYAVSWEYHTDRKERRETERENIVSHY
jgi:hypothetical protein